MNYETLRLESSSIGVTRVILSRPRYGNAYNGTMLCELLDILENLKKDSSVRVVLICGDGKNFQTGADINWLNEVRAKDSAANESVSRETACVMRSLDVLNKPTIAIVHGFCGGGGTGLISACDIVVAEKTATFAISEARWGVSASIIFPMLNAAMGVRNVRRYALTCEQFTALRALEMGLVHEVVDVGRLEEFASQLIQQILRCSPKAIELSKAGILRSCWTADSEMFDVLLNDHATVRRSEDAKEGFASFLEGRKASWSNH